MQCCNIKGGGWLGGVQLGMIFLSLLAMAFFFTLYARLHRLMGLKWPKVCNRHLQVRLDQGQRGLDLGKLYASLGKWMVSQLRVTSGDEERLGVVEMDTMDGVVVLVKLVDKGSNAVVPELDDAVVETRQDPWLLRMETQALHSVTLCLKFHQYLLLMWLGLGLK